MKLFAKSLLLANKKVQVISYYTTTDAVSVDEVDKDYKCFVINEVNKTGSHYLYIYYYVNDVYQIVQTSGINTTEYNATSRSAVAFPPQWTFSTPKTLTYDIQEKESGKVVQSFTIIYYTLEAQGGV